MKKLKSAKLLIPAIVIVLTLFITACSVLNLSIELEHNAVNIILDSETKIKADEGLVLPNGDEIPTSILHGDTVYISVDALSLIFDVNVAFDVESKTVFIGDDDDSELSELDIAVSECIEILTKSLLNPSSIQIHEIRYFRNLSNTYSIMFDYSAQNRAGGYNKEIARVTSDGSIFTTSQSSYRQSIQDSWDSATIYTPPK
jgi:hypothetical protein